MQHHFYLDTNAFRFFGTAFQNETLSADLRARILISPLSAFEVFAHLADEQDGQNVLQQIHGMRNWIDVGHCGLLPWPDDMLHQLWFQKPTVDNDFANNMSLAFEACLSAKSVDAIKTEAAKHKDVMDEFKRTQAQNFKNMVDAARQGKKKHPDIQEAWFKGIAGRAHADAASRTPSDIVSILSAYYEFESSKLKSALDNSSYNPLSKKNRNDIIDSEQLIYLGDTSLSFLTTDGPLKKRVLDSAQASRVVCVPPADLQDAKKAEAVLRANLPV